MLGVDESGLDEVDRNLMMRCSKCMPADRSAWERWPQCLSEEEDAIEEIYEPYLMQIGMIRPHSARRVATQRAYEYSAGNCRSASRGCSERSSCSGDFTSPSPSCCFAAASRNLVAPQTKFPRTKRSKLLDERPAPTFCALVLRVRAYLRAIMPFEKVLFSRRVNSRCGKPLGRAGCLRRQTGTMPI